MTRGSTDRPEVAGLIYGCAAYGAWGLLPIFWKAGAHIPTHEILAHRMLWSAITIGVVISFQRRWSTLGPVLRSRRSLALLSVSTTVIAGNWLLYIWAVNAGFVLETSLGYFINPLLSVVLGIVFLKESLRRLQWLAVGLATVGVLFMTLSYGQLPWIALGLAASFGTYGLVRKIAPVGAQLGLALESFTLALPSLAFLAYLEQQQTGAWGIGGPSNWMYLAATGPFTFLPLLWFNEGAKRLRLSTIGILQYIAPTIQLLLAVFLYGEPFTGIHLVTFGLIWTALAVFTLEGVWQERRVRRGG